MTKQELLSQLKVGSAVKADVKSSDGRYLVRRGAILTESLIEKLRIWLSKPGVVIEEPQNANADLSNENLIQQTEVNLRKLYEVPVSDLVQVIDDIKMDIYELAKRLKDDTDWTYDDDEHYYHKSTNTEHYVRVSKLAIVLANLYNQGVSDEKKIDLESIAMAALLKEYGKKFETEEQELRKLTLDNTILSKCDIPFNLLRKPYNNEFHTVYAYAALANVLPKSTRLTILLSKTKDKFSRRFEQTDPSVIAGKIINLCEVYDILLEKVITDNVPVPLENVISYMGQLSLNGTIDKNIYNFFLYHVPAFKNGTKVKLSNGETAVVVSSTPAFRTRPTVLTLPHLGSSMLIDLTERNDVVIESVVHDKNLRDKTSHYVQGQIEEIKLEEPSSESKGAIPAASQSKKIRLLNRVRQIASGEQEDTITKPKRK